MIFEIDWNHEFSRVYLAPDRLSPARISFPNESLPVVAFEVVPEEVPEGPPPLASKHGESELEQC